MRDESLPFPFSSKKWEGKAGGSEVDKERRQRTPAVVALISKGFRSETDPAGIGSKEKNPARVLRFPAGFVDWADQPCSDPRLSPRACLNRQAGFTAARLAANL